MGPRVPFAPALLTLSLYITLHIYFISSRLFILLYVTCVMVNKAVKKKNYYFSFTSYSYKVGLIRTLVDSAYKINNTRLGLHEDITKLMGILKKNLFPAHLIERVVNRYVTGTLGFPSHFTYILL